MMSIKGNAIEMVVWFDFILKKTRLFVFRNGQTSNTWDYGYIMMTSWH